MTKELFSILGFVSLFAAGASAGPPAAAIQSAQPLTDPGAFLLIGFGLLAAGALGVKKYKN
jgi:hypothetical protein